MADLGTEIRATNLLDWIQEIIANVEVSFQGSEQSIDDADYIGAFSGGEGENARECARAARRCTRILSQLDADVEEIANSLEWLAQ